MGDRTSTLTMRLVDGVSGVAPKVRAGLQSVDRAARAVPRRVTVPVAGSRAGVAADPWGAPGGGRSGAGGLNGSTSPIGLLAGGGAILTALGAQAAARRAVEGYVDFADLERRMTRIALTADETAAAGRAALAGIVRLADDVAMPVDAVIEGLETLVAQGRTLPEALAFLPAIARTAQAADAATSDIAASANALASALGISAGEMQEAFDILVGGGKAGMFELKDMAQYLPGLAPKMAALGYSGTSGLKKLVAMLQVVRKNTGEAGTAATAVGELLDKMWSSQTANNFEKFGIDLPRALRKAKADGKDLVDTFLDLVQAATKGDMTYLPQLLTDKEFRTASLALLSLRGDLTALQAALDNVDGAVMRDLSQVTEDARASVDRLRNEYQRLWRELGELGDKGGATYGLEAVANRIGRIVDTIEELERRTGGLMSGGDPKTLVESTVPVLDPSQAIPMLLNGVKIEGKGVGDWIVDTLFGGPAPTVRLPRPKPAPDYAVRPGAGGSAMPRPRPAADAPAPPAAYPPDLLPPRRPGIGGPTWSRVPVTAEELRAVLLEDVRRRRPAIALDRFSTPSQKIAAERARRRLTGPGGDVTRGAPVEDMDGRQVTRFRRPGGDAAAASTEAPRAGGRAREIDALTAALGRLEAQLTGGGAGGAIFDRARIEGDIERIRALLQQLGAEAPEIPLPLPKPVDLSAAGAETMRTFGAGLDAEMASVEARVAAFAGRLQSRLSFAARPSVQATVSVTERRVPAPGTTTAADVDYALGQRYAERVAGGFWDGDSIG